MYNELIKKMKPKPKLNLSWYQNQDLYSEGEVEDTIVRLIAENEPEDYVQAIADHYCWSTYYHLSHIRKNILNWYPFDKCASVLEIGCGMGAVTSVLCDQCEEVTSVELSKKRAIGTLLRCREKENLEIIVGNLNDIHFKKKFDYVTLIGVLEYQGSYTDAENPYLDFLKKVKSLLKPGGKLLLAIENQYGLKYWCGAREDHTGLPFEGMNQYTISGKKVKTFSKAALDSLLKDSGFSDTYFYYPLPDYKMPTIIYSQNCLPKNENMMNMQCYYTPDDYTLIAQEEKIYKDIIQNNVFDFFANSFLVECAEQDDIGEITFASLSCKRLPEYQIGTRFTKHGKVEKFALYKEQGRKHLCETLDNEEAMRRRGISLIKSCMKEQVLEQDYLEAPSVEEILLEIYRQREEKKIYEFLDFIYEEILKSSEEALWSDNILYTFDLGIIPDEGKYGPILETGYLDMIFRNAFWKNDQILWFDQEWRLENVPAKFILYRAIVQFYCSYEEVNQILPLTILAKRYGLAMLWKEFQQLDDLFSSVIIDPILLAETKGFRGDGKSASLKSINRLISQ